VLLCAEGAVTTVCASFSPLHVSCTGVASWKVTVQGPGWLAAFQPYLARPVVCNAKCWWRQLLTLELQVAMLHTGTICQNDAGLQEALVLFLAKAFCGVRPGSTCPLEGTALYGIILFMVCALPFAQFVRKFSGELFYCLASRQLAAAARHASHVRLSWFMPTACQGTIEWVFTSPMSYHVHEAACISRCNMFMALCWLAEN
jgi:hypothetical protein